MKVVCMIPARFGSKRIPQKNIRILRDKPLVAWAIEAAKKADCFDEIWVNSEDIVFKEIADEYGVKFFHRDIRFAGDDVHNDIFMEDFLMKTECDAVVQLLPTSPFVSPDTISIFASTIALEPIQAIISVKKVQIECLFNSKPINFSFDSNTCASQDLEPILAFACSPMAWKKDVFLYNRVTETGAYYASGKAMSLPLYGFETIDIDTESDWALAELVADKLARNDKAEPKYYEPGLVKAIESDVPSILKADGVENNVLFEVNNPIASVPQIIDSNVYHRSWSHRLIDSPSNSATLICQQAGEGNRRHLHYNWDEWWYIVRGTWLFEVDGVAKSVFSGNVIFIERGKIHKITAMTNGAIRLAVSRSDVPHVYVK